MPRHSNLKIHMNSHQASFGSALSGSALARLQSLQEAESRNHSTIVINLDSATGCLHEAFVLVEDCLHQFELPDFKDSVWRLRPTTPVSLHRAGAIIAAGHDYISAIPRDASDLTTVAASARAMDVASLIAARAKAFVAQAYIQLWQEAKAYVQYGVLGHQAEAYAQYAHENWELDAPGVLLRPNEPLCEKSREYLSHFCRLADCAHSYALCLHNQMRLVPRHHGLPAFEPVKAPSVDPGIAPEVLPQVSPYHGDENLNQEAIVSRHRINLCEDRREVSHFCSNFRNRRLYPKQRLVGFDRARGGRGKSGSR